MLSKLQKDKHKKNHIKTKIGVGSNVKKMVGGMEESTREVRSRKLSKEVVECVQYVVGKKKFLFQFRDGHKKDMSSVSLSYAFTEEEVCRDMDGSISYLYQKEQGQLLTIDGETFVEKSSILEIGMHFSVLYFLYYVRDISTDILEKRCWKRETRI